MPYGIKEDQGSPRNKYTPEEIFAKLRQVVVLVSLRAQVTCAIRQISMPKVTHYRWCQWYGGLKLDWVKCLKELELEHARIRKAVSDFTLDKPILNDAPRGAEGSRHRDF